MEGLLSGNGNPYVLTFQKRRWENSAGPRKRLQKNNLRVKGEELVGINDHIQMLATEEWKWISSMTTGKKGNVQDTASEILFKKDFKNLIL